MKYTKMLVCSALLVLAMLSTGCATVVRGTKQPISFTSEPAGATVRLGDGQEGMTPEIFAVKKKHGTVPFSISKEGFDEASGHLVASASGWGVTFAVANGVFGTAGALIGVPIDLVTKSYRTFDRNQVHVVLVPTRPPRQVVAEPPPPPQPPPAQVRLRADPPVSIEEPATTRVRIRIRERIEGSPPDDTDRIIIRVRP